MAATTIEHLPRIRGPHFKSLRRTPDKPSSPFRPPDTLPIEIPVPAIRSAFQSAVTGNLHSDLKNNASLEAEDVANVARQTYRNPMVQQISFVMTLSFLTVVYRLISEDDPKHYIFISIANCKDAHTAQKMMADHLSMFQAKVSTVTKRPGEDLGQVALQTDSSVFWIRDAMWIRLFMESGVEEKKKKGLLRSSEEEFLANSVAGSERVKTFKAALSGRLLNKASMHLMLRFAVRIDSYLAKDAVLPAQQRKPETKVDTSNCRAVWGDSFVIKLVDPSNTRKFSQVEAENPSIVIPTENKDPNAKGLYTFFANEPGRTKIKIMVARADNFATGTVEVQVEVIDG